ncbi:hypothetical protein M1545_03625 [Patescibacteria group bacterium]|nr:hypothetical protein [Patescibacteria group bacterium]
MSLSHSQIAKELNGRHLFFGPREWKKYLGEKVEAGPLNLSREKVRDLGIRQPHIFFWGSSRLAGHPLNLEQWLYENPKGPEPPNFYTAARFLKYPLGQTVLKEGWYFILLEGMPGTANRPYAEQMTYLYAEGYKNPNTIEMTTAVILGHLLTGKYPISQSWVRVRESDGEGSIMSMRGYESHGLSFKFWPDGSDPDYKIAASLSYLPYL